MKADKPLTDHSDSHAYPAFLRRGGEAAGKILSYNWHTTSLGPVEQWPASLKQHLANVLTHVSPVLIFWEPAACFFFNDAFLGLPFVFKTVPFVDLAKYIHGVAWKSIADGLTSMAHDGEAKGIQINIPADERAGQRDYFYDLDFAHLRDAEGRQEGVLIWFKAKTEQMRELRLLRSYKANSDLFIQQAPIGICIVMGKSLSVVKVNDAFLDMIGKSREEVINKSYWEVQKDIKDVYEPITHWVMQAGKSYRSKEQVFAPMRNGKPIRLFVDFVYEPLKDISGQIIGFTILSIDVTERNTARTVLEETNQNLADTNNKLEATQAKLEDSIAKIGHLAALVQSSEDVIISQDMQGVITSWNGAAEKMFGFRAEEAIGQHISIIHPEGVRVEATTLTEKVRGGERVHQFETLRKHRDGTLRELSLTLSPIFDEKGAIIGVSKIARDIAVQKEAIAATARYAARLEALNRMIQTVSEELDLDRILQKVTDDTTLLVGAEYGAFFFNRTGEKDDFYELHALTGACRELFSKTGAPFITEIFRNTFTGIGPVRYDDLRKESRFMDLLSQTQGTDAVFPVASYLAIPVVSRSGTMLGGLFFGHTKPERFNHDHETLLIAIAGQASVGLDNAILYEKVKLLNDKKDEFIGLASHELKTPLTTIKGYLQILERRTNESQEKLFLERASQQVKKLTMLVNDLLDVSKIEAGKLRLSMTDFDVLPVLQEAVDLTEQNHRDHRVVLESTVDVCIIHGDSQRLEQVIINLLNNAVKYSPGKFDIVVSLTRTEKEVLLSVKDTGIGIPPDKLREIFSRFFRVDDNSPNISGLGMGLYLCHEIVTRHSGRIWVESKLGEGSTFWVSLPLGNAENKVD
ncbi:PAS domain-containing sensor histidine kinase [Sphingobacterium suaedae]|uniref:histidine kinase n=1 Tax=Sphingobacterium suaedae TaxID=1686402 RepID=A0ABW5KFR7_9SPHI